MLLASILSQEKACTFNNNINTYVFPFQICRSRLLFDDAKPFQGAVRGDRIEPDTSLADAKERENARLRAALEKKDQIIAEVVEENLAL